MVRRVSGGRMATSLEGMCLTFSRIHHTDTMFSLFDPLLIWEDHCSGARWQAIRSNVSLEYSSPLLIYFSDIIFLFYRYGIVSEYEWNKLNEFYESDFEIKIRNVGKEEPIFETDPGKSINLFDYRLIVYIYIYIIL